MKTVSDDKEKQKKIFAHPPSGFSWVEDFGDLEKLSEVYAKLESIANFFSFFREPSAEHPVMASELYGYWFILKDICADLADVLKVDYWSGGIGLKRDCCGEERE